MTCYHQPSLQPGAVMDHVLEKCAVLSMKTREDVATLTSSTSSGKSTCRVVVEEIVERSAV